MQPQHYYSVALQLIEPATVDYSAFLFKAQRIASSIQSHDFFAVPMGINGFQWFCSQPQQNSRRFAVFRFFVHVDDDFNWDLVASCRLFYSELCPFDKDDPTCNCDARRMYQQVLRYNVHVCNHFCSAGACAVKLRHTRFTTSVCLSNSSHTLLYKRSSSLRSSTRSDGRNLLYCPCLVFLMYSCTTQPLSKSHSSTNTSCILICVCL